MHRFQSRSTITRIRFAALLLCLRWLLLPVVLGLLGYALVMHNRELTFYALAGGAAIIVLGIVQWVLAQRTRCPLCMTPVLAAKHCAKHRRARTVLGSYRLRVALAVIFRGSFSCPYCNEPSVMEVRVRASDVRGRRC